MRVSCCEEISAATSCICANADGVVTVESPWANWMTKVEIPKCVIEEKVSVIVLDVAEAYFGSAAMVAEIVHTPGLEALTMPALLT